TNMPPTPIHSHQPPATPSNFQQLPGTPSNSQQLPCNFQQLSCNSQQFEMPVDNMSPCYKFDRKFHIIIPTRRDWEDKPTFMETSSQLCYTDGSKTSALTGASYYFPQENSSEAISMGIYATVPQSEIMGILSATVKALSTNNEAPLIIFTDSQATLKALRNHKVSSALLSDCFDTLQSVANYRQTSLAWVPGHMGIEGNEKADELARKGSSSAPIGP